MINIDNHSQPFKIKGKVRGLSPFYLDGTERVEIWIDKRYQNSLPARNNQKIPVKLFFNSESYEAGLHMTANCPHFGFVLILKQKARK